jgi:molybdate transport system substrate-binding protein
MTRRILLADRQKVSAIVCIVLAVSVAAVACSPHPAQQVLSVAAAADLQFALDELSRGFRAAHPAVVLRVAYGSSGNFSAQIQNQAPFDLFLSADMEYPRQLVRQGIGVPDSVFVYALGRMAVWVPAASSLDPATVLRSPALTHLAIANPQHAPYGRAAEAALRALGAYDAVKDRLVFGENVAQTLEFVQSGAADAGIIALSLALAPSVREQGRYWILPANLYPKMEQGGMIVKDSLAARDFRAFLLSPAGARVLEAYGFSLPGN